MNRKWIKGLALPFAALVLMSAAMTGCSNSDTGKPLDSEGRVIVKVTVPQGESYETLTNKLIEDYQKTHENVTFETEQIVGDYSTKLITQASAGTAPDVVYISDVQSRVLASKNVLIPLDDYYDKLGIDTGDFYESMLEIGQYDGKQYMIPRDYNHIVTYYNKALFDQAEVPYPEDGWTWEEFLETAYKFPQKSKDVYTVRSCQAWLNWGATAPIIFMGLGGTMLDENEQANFNTPGSVKALETIKQLVDDGVFVNEYMNDIGNFESGKIAMVFQTRSVLSGYVQALGAENIGVTTFPVLPEKHMVGSGSSGYAVVSTSRCQDEAAEFAFYILSEEAQLEFSKLGDCVPIRKSMADDETWRESVPGIPADPFVDHMEYDVPQPSISVKNNLLSIRYDGCWQNAFSALLSNLYDATGAAEYGQQEFENAINNP